MSIRIPFNRSFQEQSQAWLSMSETEENKLEYFCHFAGKRHNLVEHAVILSPERTLVAAMELLDAPSAVPRHR